MAKRNFKEHKYQNPFQNPHASPKHAYHQVNGETRQTQNIIILERETRNRA